MNRRYSRPNFAAVKKNVTIQMAAEHLGFTFKQLPNGQMRSQCLLCDHESPRAFVITPKLGLFFCFVCRAGGDVLRLTAIMRKESEYAAACYLEDHFKPPR